jgi:hypothetical protein
MFISVRGASEADSDVTWFLHNLSRHCGQRSLFFCPLFIQPERHASWKRCPHFKSCIVFESCSSMQIAHCLLAWLFSSWGLAPLESDMLAGAENELDALVSEFGLAAWLPSSAWTWMIVACSWCLTNTTRMLDFTNLLKALFNVGDLTAWLGSGSLKLLIVEGEVWPIPNVWAAVWVSIVIATSYFSTHQPRKKALQSSKSIFWS